MFKEYFEKALSAVSAGREDELLAARRRYVELVGEYFEDEDFYEERVKAFLEWFFFDYRLTAGVTPLELYLANFDAAGDERAYLEDVSRNICSTFEIKKINPKKELIVLIDQRDAKKYEIKERRNPLGINKGEMLYARIFPHMGHWLFTDSFCAHPKDASSVIKKAAKLMRKTGEGDFCEWNIFLVRKRWLLERYPKAKPETVYRDDFAPNWFDKAHK